MWWSRCLVLMVFTTNLFVLSQSLSPVVTTSGYLRGRIVQTPQGLVRQLLGVRYADAPLGNLRFMPPQIYVTMRTDVVAADKFAPACIQPSHRTEFMYAQLAEAQKNRNVSEDCLFLNVFLPVEKTNRPRAILVFLPGEGFSFADPAQWDASRMAIRGDIIVITVAYRVGVLGFLSTSNKAAPGNAGIWDILEALRWVRRNAAAVGGDPRRVTLLGRFSGSMAASLLLTSPLLIKEHQPLAQRFILQSGVATKDYVIDPDPRNRTLTLAELAECPLHEEQAMLHCLRKLPASEVDRISWHVAELWRPIVDSWLVVSEPWKLAHLREIPPGLEVMVGETSGEGALCLLQHFFLETSLASQILADSLTSADFDQLISEHIRDHNKVNNPLLETIVQHEYRHALNDYPSYRTRFLHFCGNLYTRLASEQLARELAFHGTKVYRYEFSHRPSASHHPIFLGAAHGDDALFVFALVDAFVEGNNMEPDPEELVLQSQMVTALTSFVKTGNPNTAEGFTTAWPRFLPSSFKQLIIHARNNTEVSDTKALTRDLEFWSKVAPKVLRETSPIACAVANSSRARGAAVLIMLVLGLLVLSLLFLVVLMNCRHSRRRHVLLEMQLDT